MINQSTQADSDGDSWGVQLRKGCLELAILALLWPEPLYGLDILRALRNSGLTVAEGTLYAILNRLRSEGFLISEWRESVSGRPRTYYSLTKMGRTRTKTMAAIWNGFSQSIDNILRIVPVKTPSTEELTHEPAK